MAAENPMRKISIEKITLNMGTGADEEKTKKAVLLLSKFSEKKPVICLAKKRLAAFNIRPGVPIGAKVTLRKKKAQELLMTLLKAKEFTLSKDSFDENGFAFGISEYIDIPGMKYDSKIGMMGMDVCITLSRPGFRVKNRRFKSKISTKHKILKADAISFAEKELGVKVQ